MLNSASLSLASTQGVAALQRVWPGLIGCSMTNLQKACFQCATGSGLRVVWVLSPGVVAASLRVRVVPAWALSLGIERVALLDGEITTHSLHS